MIEQVLALLGVEIEDLAGRFKPINHLLIVQSSLLHRDDFIQRDKAIVVDVSGACAAGLLGRGRVGLGLVHCLLGFLADFFVVVFKPIGLGADEVAAARAQQAANECAEQPVFLGENGADSRACRPQ